MKTLIDINSNTYLEINLTEDLDLHFQIKENKTADLIDSFILNKSQMHSLFVIFHKAEEIGIKSTLSDIVFLSDKKNISLDSITMRGRSLGYYKIKLIFNDKVYYYLIDKEISKFLSNPIKDNANIF